MMWRPFAALALAGVAATAGAKQDSAAEALAGRTAGKPQRCISLPTTQSPQVLEDGAILYRETGKRVWITRTIGQCSLRPLDTLIVDVFGSQLCRNDRFRTVSPGMSIPSAYCRFGDFTPYAKP